MVRPGLAEVPGDLTLLGLGETRVCKGEHREHGQRQQRRPLQEEADHDDARPSIAAGGSGRRDHLQPRGKATVRALEGAHAVRSHHQKRNGDQ